MLFSFPFGGYFLYSIIFSSLFIICTYWFSIFFLKRSKKYNFIRFSISKSVDVENDKPLSLKFVHWGIYFLILSSIGIWLLPVAIVKAGKGSDWYNSALYFFLHFQYNGWFLAVLFGLLVGEIEHKSLLNSKRLKGALYNFVIGTIGSVTLSWVGFFNEPILYIIGNISGFLLLASIFELYRAYMQLEKPAFLMQMFLLLCMLKTIFMFLGSFPWIAEVVLPNREFVISYLHFTFLGVIGFGVLHFLEKNLHIHFPYWSLSLYTTAFVGSEILITYKGIAILCELFVPDNYYLLLVVFSSLFFIAVGYWCYIIFRKVRNKSIEKDN
jgi:putative membrane protein